MATVYHAFDPSFDREVAIKVLPREMLHDPQFRSRFERELKIVAGLEHPAIVPVYDVGEENDQPYFVMRYMPGGSLSNEIEKGRFSLEDAARIIERIAQGLAYAHRKGIIHRDLKPDNILFDSNGDPFISDFGVAKLTESTGSLTGSGIIGTPAYMSPEQAQGNEIDGRSDVYGLGVILYQMLSGQQPYNADTPMGVVVKHITEPVPEILKTMPSLPVEVDDLIKKAMAKDRAKRFQTTIELAKALNLIAFGSEGNITRADQTGIRTGVFKNDAKASAPRNSKTGIIVAAVVAVVLLIGGFALRNQLFAAPPAPTSTPIPPTFTPLPAPTKPQFAPACSAGIAIPTPEVKETNKSCVQKVPYTSITIPKGAVFTPLSEDLRCNEEATKDGITVISCSSFKQLFSYQLKVCTPPQISPADQLQCPANATYSSANACCVGVPPQEAGCTIFKVDIGACQ